MDKYQSPKKMKKLGDLFQKYQDHFRPPQASIETAFIEVVKEVTDFELKPDFVNYTVSTRTIGITVPSILKTEIKFKQKDILQRLEDRLGKKSAPKIII
tara:strand:+ start:624 stop:920 length:297 start_codon:yes stop_codon:yes gene_type:complete